MIFFFTICQVLYSKKIIKNKKLTNQNLQKEKLLNGYLQVLQKTLNEKLIL